MNISNYTNEVALNKLNELLLSKDLIRTISSCQNILLGSDIDDCLDKLEILSEYEIVSLNRLFLDEVYEKYSPQLETGMVKWFKIWKKWFYRPSVYFEPYASPYLINESNSYIGCITENEKDFVVLDNVSGNLSFSPTITFTPHLSFLGVVLGVESKAGIENNISLKFYTDVETLKQKTSGKGESKLFFKLNCFTGFFITLPFGFGTRGVNWSFDLMKPKEYKLCSWKF